MVFRALALALLLAFPLFGGQSLHITTGDTASFTPPDSAPWTSLGAFRGEIGIKLNTCTNGRFFNLGAFLVQCSSANTLNLQTGIDSLTLDVTGRSEVLLRFQSDPLETLASSSGGNPLAHLEIWDADGTDYLANSATDNATPEDVSSIQTFTTTDIDIEIHWIKLYSTLTEVGRNSPLPDPHGTGDLADWEFEGVLTDSGPDSMTISASGHAFSSTAALNPVADPTVDADPYWMPEPSVRAGAEITLSAERSIAHDDVSTLTCVWSDQTVGGSGPTAILFTGSTTACTTTAVFPTYGDYDLRLVVTDNGALTGTANVTVGAVATDSNRIVVMDDDAFAFALGENIQWGHSAWPFLPDRIYKMAESFAASRSTAGWQTKGAGTVTMTNGSATVTGSGTNFQATYCSGGSTPDSNIFIVTDSNGINWRANNVSSCDSATQLTLDGNWNQATEGSMQYSFWSSANATAWSGGSENENYYDNVLAYYLLCKTSGLQWACDEAASLAALWWEMPAISEGKAGLGPNGSSKVSPRIQSLIGIMLWAKAQGTESAVFPGIEDAIEYYDNLWVTHSTNYCPTDPREAWYVGMWLSLARKLDIDATRIANYDSILTAAMDASAGASGGEIDPDICRYPNGGWITGIFQTPNAGSSTVSVTNGSPTFTCASPGACSWTSADIGKYAQIGVLNDKDRVSDVGQYEITAQDSNTLTVSPNFAGTPGSGRFYFIREINTYGHQALGNAMANIALDWQRRDGFSDHRQAMVDTFDYIEDTVYWSAKKGLYNLSDDAGCAIDIGNSTLNSNQLCQFDPNSTASSRRFLSLEIASTLTYGVRYGREIDDANTAARITFGDTLMAAAMGGLGGPSTDTTWATEYDDDEVTFTIGNGKQKNFGFCCGVGGASTWDAERLGGLAAEDLVSFNVPLDIGSVSMATKATVTLYEPRGFSRVVNDQTGSTASVTGDKRQGDHLAKIEYKDSMDSVLQTDLVMASAPAPSSTGTTFEGSITLTGTVTGTF